MAFDQPFVHTFAFETRLVPPVSLYSYASSSFLPFQTRFVLPDSRTRELSKIHNSLISSFSSYYHTITHFKSNMKHIITFLIWVISLAAFSSAQNVGTQPACVQNSFNTVLLTPPSPCTATNFTCLCNSNTFISSIVTELQKECNSTEQAEGIQFGVATCKTLGVTVTLPPGVGGTAPAPSSSSSAAAPPPASTTNSKNPNGSNTLKISVVGALIGLGLAILAV